jgi:hypothetical protein
MPPYGLVSLYMARIDPVNDRLWRNLAILTRLRDGYDIHQISPFSEFIEIIVFLVFTNIIEIIVCQVETPVPASVV